MVLAGSSSGPVVPSDSAGPSGGAPDVPDLDTAMPDDPIQDSAADWRHRTLNLEASTARMTAILQEDAARQAQTTANLGREPINRDVIDKLPGMWREDVEKAVAEIRTQSAHTESVSRRALDMATTAINDARATDVRVTNLADRVGEALEQLGALAPRVHGVEVLVTEARERVSQACQDASAARRTRGCPDSAQAIKKADELERAARRQSEAAQSNTIALKKQFDKTIAASIRESDERARRWFDDLRREFCLNLGAQGPSFSPEGPAIKSDVSHANQTTPTMSCSETRPPRLVGTTRPLRALAAVANAPPWIRSMASLPQSPTASGR